jgi:hypothetical protein
LIRFSGYLVDKKVMLSVEGGGALAALFFIFLGAAGLGLFWCLAGFSGFFWGCFAPEQHLYSY